MNIPIKTKRDILINLSDRNLKLMNLWSFFLRSKMKKRKKLKITIANPRNIIGEI